MCLDPDFALIQQCKNGNLAAAEQLFSKYRDRLVAIAGKIVGNNADAEDAVQNASINALTHIQEWQPTGTFYSWLCRIVSRCALDILRQRQRRRLHGSSDEIANSSAKADSPERHLQNAESAERVWMALNCLSDKERTAIVLREYEGLSVEEIDYVMQCSIAKVNLLLASARRKLKEFLADLNPLAGAEKAHEADQQVAIVEQAASADVLPIVQDRFPYIFAATHSFQGIEFRIVAAINGDGKKRLIAMQQATQDPFRDWESLAAAAQACCQGMPQLLVIDPDEPIFEKFCTFFASTTDDGTIANFQFCTATPTFPSWTKEHPDCLVSFQRFPEQHHELLKSTNLIRNAFRDLQVPASPVSRARLIESAVRDLLSKQRKITGWESLPK